ncbi:MAG: response regulator transcription factor [Bacteroidetes bacterium]|nr:response regulator transcription factor [Bacteroidota bacterium]
MIKALIIDDEEKAVNILHSLIVKNIPEITNIEKVYNAMDAFYTIRDFKPDLVFLDIQMPFLNGFDLLNKIENINFDVIFTTAFNQYAIKAIRFSALDYLLKPIDIAELRSAVDRHLERRTSISQTGLQYKNLVNNLSAKSDGQFSLAINGSQGMQFLTINEIIRLEGDRNYTNFVLTNNRKILSSKTLKEYEEILVEKGFLRVHKSHLVNRSFISSISNDGNLNLKDDSLIEVSRRRMAEIRRMLTQ